MTSKRHLDVAWTGSLYEPSSDTILTHIERLLDECKQGDTVLVRVNADCHDYSNSWLSYLKEEALWQDLALRLERWYVVLAKITFSKARWYFLADGDVVGSWWEFALAFHGRVFTNPYAKVGFPEIYIDLFPPLGIAALKKFSAYENASQIRSRAILHAKDAYKVGLVDLCLLSDEWTRRDGLPHLDAWFQKKILDPDVKGSTLQHYLRSFPSIEQTQATRGDAHYRRRWLESARLESAFDIVREKNTSQKAIRLAEVRAAAATRFLMNDYVAWLSRRVARYRLGLHDRWWSISSDLVAIDITHGLPPHEIIKTFLLRRKKLVFTAARPEVLRVGLETLRSQFDRRDDEGKTALSVWNEAVSWVCLALTDVKRAIVCEFTWDNKLLFRYGSLNLSYLRISGNHASAGKGWYEDLNSDQLSQDADEKDQEEILETLSLIANGILKPKRMFSLSEVTHAALPLTLGIRLVVLEFLLNLGEHVPRCKSILDVFKLLGSSGWGFAADPYQWEALLKSHGSATASLQPIFARLIGNRTWKLTQLRGVMDHKFSRHQGVSSLDLRSGSALTRYLELFCQTLVEWLYREGYVSTVDEADLLVTLSLGYPGMLPLPHALNHHMGKDRVIYWNGLVAEVFKDGFSL